MSERIREWLDESQRLADEATDGPWIAEFSGEQGDCVIPHDAQSTREAVAVCRLSYRGADARLIAESRTRLPQAVAALKTVMDLHRPLRDARDWSRRCGECEQPWPCLTVMEITADLGLEGDDDDDME